MLIEHYQIVDLVLGLQTHAVDEDDIRQYHTRSIHM